MDRKGWSESYFHHKMIKGFKIIKKILEFSSANELNKKPQVQQ